MIVHILVDVIATGAPRNKEILYKAVEAPARADRLGFMGDSTIYVGF